MLYFFVGFLFLVFLSKVNSFKFCVSGSVNYVKSLSDCVMLSGIRNVKFVKQYFVIIKNSNNEYNNIESQLGRAER